MNARIEIFTRHRKQSVVWSDARLNNRLVILLTTICVILIFILRGADRLRNPQLWAEDGSIFFQDAYNLSFWESILKTYKGYYHLLPRLFAEAALILRLELVPTVFVIVALIIGVFCCCFFLLDGFSWIIASRYQRSLICIVFAALPANDEVVLRFVNMQWYIGLLAMLLVLLEMPRSWLGRLSYITIWLIVVATAPQTVIFLPCLLVRAWFERHHRPVLLFASTVVATVFVFVAYNSASEPSITKSPFDASAFLIAVFNVLAYRVFATASLGLNTLLNVMGGAYAPLAYIWYLPSLVFAGSVAILLLRHRRYRQLILWSYFGYCIVAPVLLALAGRPALIQDAQLLTNLTGGERYYMLSIAALYLAAFWAVATFAEQSRWLVPALGLLCLLLMPAISSDFAVARLNDRQWYAEVQRIKLREAQSGGTITVPLAPYTPWAMQLEVPLPFLPPMDAVIVTQQQATGGFDTVAADVDGGRVVKRGELLRATGWALADLGNVAIDTVILVDTTSNRVLARTQLGTERPDVAATINQPTALHSGWDVTFAVWSLEVGQHRIQAYLYDDQKGIAYPIAGKHTIDVIQ
jgi:hypothetical protein